MKKWFLSFSTLLAVLLLIPTIGLAQVKFIKLTVKSAKLWPAKPSGKCWDPCFGKKYKLPARGAKKYMRYFENKQFKAACEGSKTADAFVVLKIGKYESFSTDKINNTCTPQFNVSKIFRVTAKDNFTVSVYDNDGAAQIRFKKDLMGTKTYAGLPPELLNGGTLTIRNIGQVEELVLTAEVLKRPTSMGVCQGVYNVRIVETEVQSKKANGKTWDWKWAGSKPDLVVKMKIGPHEITTQKHNNTLVALFSNAQKTIAIKKGLPVNLEVLDQDPTGQEKIGQTAETDVCKLIKGNGTYTFSNFGQVTKVVVIFEKLK